MPGQKVGSLIGAAFGLVYVWVNSGALPVVASTVLRTLAVAAAVAVVVAVLRLGRRAPAVPADAGPARGFGRAYWAVVLAEVVALFGGLRVLDAAFDLSYAGVAWVSVVVGIHFVALAVVWRQAVFHLLGAAIAMCGTVALLLAVLLGDEPAVPVVGGVVPGALLLATAWWGAHRRPRASDETSPTPAKEESSSPRPASSSC